jgi:hypothetical protein
VSKKVSDEGPYYPVITYRLIDNKYYDTVGRKPCKKDKKETLKVTGM